MKYPEDFINKIICGDCLEVMKDIPDKSVSAVISDPPYGLGFKNQEWDRQLVNWLDEAKRISDIVIFTTAPLTMWDYPRPDWVLCWYRDAAQSRSLLGGFNHWSPVLVYGKPKFKIDSIKLHAMANATYVNHPSPKPLKLMNWLITNSTEVKDIVLDPFVGSGTTAVSAKYLNRNFIGIEISPEYCKIAEQRLAQEVIPF